jgi:hypothetical protein
VQTSKFSVIAAVAAAFALSGCATTSSTQTTAAASANNQGSTAAATPSGASGPQRDLTAPEKKAVMDAVAPSLRDPGSAKYFWTKFPMVVTDNSVNYCGTVDAKSPYPAYNGKQAYIVEAHMSGGHVSGAVMGLIAGGKDAKIVAAMCSKYGLDPYKTN